MEKVGISARDAENISYWIQERTKLENDKSKHEKSIKNLAGRIEKINVELGNLGVVIE